MDSISLTLEAMKSISGRKWDTFWEKVLWVALGIIGTYIATKLNIK
jgi:hypothetical protein